MEEVLVGIGGGNGGGVRSEGGGGEEFWTSEIIWHCFTGTG